MGNDGWLYEKTLGGKAKEFWWKIDLGGRQAYLDATQGRVMVPLRPLVEALGGKVEWYPVLPEYREIEAEHNYGQPPTGEQVAARVETTLGDKRWGIYLTEEQSGSVVVPLHRFALIFGYELSWDASRFQVNLEATPKMLFHLGNTQLTNYTSLELFIKDLKSHYRTELAWITPEPQAINNLYTVDSKEMDYNGDGTKSRVSFVTLALNREHLRKSPDDHGELLLDPGFFIYKNGITGNFEYIKITGALEFDESNYIIRFEDIIGDGNPEIFYELVTVLPGSDNNATPHMLLYHPETGKFVDINMSAALNSIIADWGFEDLNRDGLNELWLDVINLLNGETVRKHAALEDSKLILY